MDKLNNELHEYLFSTNIDETTVIGAQAGFAYSYSNFQSYNC